MDDKGLKERCTRITRVFDTPDRKYPISSFTEMWDRLEPMGLYDKIHSNLVAVFSEARDVAFALGFVIGQSVDLTDPDAQEDINAIMKEIRYKGLLPYVPKEKKAKKV